MADGGTVLPRGNGQGARRGSAFRQWNTFVLGWIVRPDRRGRGALGSASSSDQCKRAMGSPARRIARGFQSRVSSSYPCKPDFSGTEADRVVADAFGMYPEFFIFGDHRIHAIEQ